MIGSDTSLIMLLGEWDGGTVGRMIFEFERHVCTYICERNDLAYVR